MTFIKVASVVVIAGALVACQSQDGAGSKTGIGALGGAAGGGLIAAAAGGGAAAIAGGVILGGLLGGAIGNYLDDQDKRTMHTSTQKSLETTKTGETSAWSNPDSGHSGTVTPVRTYQTADGKNCREFQQAVTVGGKTEKAYGTACRDENGNWKIVQ